MAKNLFKPSVDQGTVDNLISGTLVPAKVIPVTLSIPAGEDDEIPEVIERGTLLKTSDGETYTPIEEGDEIHGILLLDIETEDEDELISAPVAFGGEFNQNKIEEVNGFDLSPLTIANARARQIFIAPMEPAPEPFTI